MTDLRFQKQKYLHRPDQGEFGDCFRTAIACMLAIPRDDVPHWFGTRETSEEPRQDVWDAVHEWLAENHGLRLVKFIYEGETPLETVLQSVKNLNGDLRFLLAGKSRTGVNHSVICRNGEIEHDPSRTASGIVGPCDDGYWWLEFLSPILEPVP